MATVKSVINPSVTANTPFAYTAPNGLSGYVTTMMLDDNEVVVMVFDDAVDQIGSNVTVKHPIDMSDYWTLDPYYSNVTEGDFFNIGIMNIEFEGNTYTLQHVIYYLNAGWWLTRRATNGEYVASGKNILSNYDTVYTLPDGLTLSDIESSDTDIEGLKPPISCATSLGDRRPSPSINNRVSGNHRWTGSVSTHEGATQLTRHSSVLASNS
jgi:hypothetical protein